MPRGWGSVVLGFTLCWLTPPLGTECVGRNKIKFADRPEQKSSFPYKPYIDYLSADFLVSPCQGLESCRSHDESILQ